MEWPFSACLPRQLNVGDKIELEGIVANDTEMFTINLVCEHDPSSKPHNVAYHHKVLFNEERIVVNSKHNGDWQDEEELQDISLSRDIVPGEPFNIMFLILEEEILMYVGGMHHSQFSHRLPYQDIRHIQIWNGVEKVNSMKVTFADR